MIDSLSLIYTWIDGPYKSVAIMFVTIFIVVNALEMGLPILKGYITKKLALKGTYQQMELFE
jgi:hypothetical protein